MWAAHPHGVRLAQPHGIGQFDLDLGTVERAEHTHHLQQAVVQPIGGQGRGR